MDLAGRRKSQNPKRIVGPSALMVNTGGNRFVAAPALPIEPIVEMRVGAGGGVYSTAASTHLPGGVAAGGNYQLFNFVPVLQDPTPVITITKVPPKKASHHAHSQTPLVCGVCPYQTTRRDLLTRHVKTHEAEVQQCDRCEFASSRNDVLAKHKKTAHEGLREALDEN